MQGWSNGVLYTGLGMLVAGFVLLVLGWNGAANLDYTQGQIPFLISGGIGGLGLIVGGLALLVVHSLRQDMLLLGLKLDAMVDTLRGLGGADGLGPTAVPEDEGLQVVAGRTTYHARSCHLVEGRDDLQVMSPQAAKDRGLAPCRICKPHETEDAEESA